MQDTWVQSLGWEDPLEKETATLLQYPCLENSIDRGGGGGGQGLETQVQEGGDAGDPPVGPIQSREPKMAAHGHHLLFSSFLGAILGLLRWLSCKASSCQCRRRGFNPWVGKIPWRRKWQPTPVLSGKSHRQRKLVGYSPWGGKESDMTEWRLSSSMVQEKQHGTPWPTSRSRPGAAPN